MRKYINRFFGEKKGAELVQWCIIIAIAAMLAVVALEVGKKASSKAEEANNMMDQITFSSDEIVTEP